MLAHRNDLATAGDALSALFRGEETDDTEAASQLLAETLSIARSYMTAGKAK